eukprot:CAMPEP_0183303910 /NCGR_PEP_ID=MMETSP0160_2-20130417/9184_1 /TAXON_ID=2839 ORGANISM="Odontella Sinensis, Strain Grunow 1884" /NCGR_SAMPLE_ID=MMETSP0160_2 /ASSEMBLY_ACC=CAM_ASM_000250 /LENGTH=221 /DNA_ID=CAMNT_0025466885 /DNA_START=32 /DNA_END=697 /DNA_ORIENTATION=-
MTITRPLLLLLGLSSLLLGPSSALLNAEETEVEVIGNPHATKETEHTSGDRDTCDSSSACEPKLLLSPHRIIRTRSVATQADTLVGVETKKVLGVPVPVYQFRQPARLSAAELPFKLILVSDIDSKVGLSEVPVDPKAASDSWFPGYRWSPVVCSACGNHVHVGWKFSRPDSGGFFYALIVEAKEKRRESIVMGALGALVGEAIDVGVRAPGWMISALAKA